MNPQLTKQMSLLTYLSVPIGKNEGTPPRKPYSLLYLFATLFTWIGRIQSNGANKTYVLRSEIRINQEHCLQQMYACRQQILPLLCFRIKAMRRVPETNIFLRNNNCTTALSMWDVTLKRPTIFRFSFPHEDCSWKYSQKLSERILCKA